MNLQQIAADRSDWIVRLKIEDRPGVMQADMLSRIT